MSMFSLLHLKENPSAKEEEQGCLSGLPLTIDPICIDNRNSHSDDEGPMESATVLHGRRRLTAMGQGSVSRRPSLALEQTTPQYVPAPSSASSSLDYLSASGYLTPYSASTCSSRHDSTIPFENPQHYTLSSSTASPSPQVNDPGIGHLDHCVLQGSFANTQISYGEPTILVEDEAQIYTYKYDATTVESNIAEWCPNEDAVINGSISHTKSLSEPRMPDYLSLGPHANIEQACCFSEMIDTQEHLNDHLSTQKHFETSDQNGSRRPSLDEPFEYRIPSSSSRASNQEFWNNMDAARLAQSSHRQKRQCTGLRKSHRRTEVCTIRDAGTCWLEEKGPIEGEKEKRHRCRYCVKSFARPEHCHRHEFTHDKDAPEVHCPLCDKPIKIRKDNLKAHVIKTHFRPSEKKMTEKMNSRWTMKDMFELFQKPLNGNQGALWLNFFQKHAATGSPEEIWPLVRGMDPRFNRLLANEMTIHDREKLQHDEPGEFTGKLTKFWTMLGWSIAEAQEIRVKDIDLDWEGPAHATLWDIDARRKALEDGTLTVEDAEFLGVNMLESRAMGLERLDPRWQALLTARMSINDSEKHGVKHINPQWKLSASKRKRSDR